jgi:hypothetical protein
MATNPHISPDTIAALETMDDISRAVQDRKNIISVTFFPNHPAVWNEATVVAAGDVFTLKFYGEHEAWEAIGPKGRYLFTGSAAAPLSLAIDRLVGLRD